MMSKYGVHETHCCSLHGCKYHDDDCPVANGSIKQKYICESCSYAGIDSLATFSFYEGLLSLSTGHLATMIDNFLHAGNLTLSEKKYTFLIVKILMERLELEIYEEESDF